MSLKRFALVALSRVSFPFMVFYRLTYFNSRSMQNQNMGSVPLANLPPPPLLLANGKALPAGLLVVIVPANVQQRTTSQSGQAGDDDHGGDHNRDSGSGTAVIAKTKTLTRRPSMYRVLILNDDYTPMEFVVQVLRIHFNKNLEEATKIMLHVHHHGVGECGVFTFEVAETKVTQVMDFARKHQHPLQCIMEKK